jgi:uncharacterized protein YndB with AHSA1/START domain
VRVYGALVDERAVVRWMVPEGMTSRVHAFDPREEGALLDGEIGDGGRALEARARLW